MFYTEEQTKSFHQQHFEYLIVKEENHVLYITLHNPARKNALSPQLLNELAYTMAYGQYASEVWIIVLQSEGNVFCSGADLKAFAGNELSTVSSIPKPERDIVIGEIFTSFHKPSIAKVEGDVYAGGFLLLCGVRFVLANNGLKFGLPEVKRGLYPFQVMAALMEVMPARRVLDWCVRGYNLPVADAANLGLVTKVVAEGEMENELANLIEELKQNSPTAMLMGIAAYEKIKKSASPEEHEAMKAMLGVLLKTENAVEGLTAFKEKRKPIWK